jgi:hypothetical protein
VKKKKLTSSDRWFYGGVICCLHVILDAHDQPTIAEDILRGCDVGIIRQIAEENGETDASIIRFLVQREFE